MERAQSARGPREGRGRECEGSILALGGCKPQNLLLVRDEVGRPRVSCFKLPEPHFSYGRPGNQDAEGAREVSMKWAQHVASPEPQHQVNFLQVNRRAITAPELRHVTHVTHSKAPKEKGPRVLIPSDVVPNFAYGRKVRPSTPMQEVISARFAEKAEKQLLDFYSEMKDLREAKGHEVRKIPLTKATRAHRALLCAPLERQEKPFKLSKFNKVRAKVTSFRQKSEAAEILDLEIAQMNPEPQSESDHLPVSNA